MDHSKHQEYMRRMVMQQQQEQETNRKKNQEQGGGNNNPNTNTNTNNNNSVERRTTIGGGGGSGAGAKAKANAVNNINSSLISFLEKDESFLTPWSWDPNNDASGSLNQGRKNYHQFQRGTFFYRESSSPDSSGFGRTLSKKSLDMAIRHMDIRQRVPGNLRPLMTNIRESSMYSVRTGAQRSRTVSVSGSPHATSSNAGSEVSVNQNGYCLDSSEIDDDVVSERGVQSPTSVRGR
ncbi:hypothetical protein PIB30_008809 [Stylosanthes scabra]|uniref:Uncharacterized protein n=1 Tax=Stylosanthes scabra TaxID=79078 RepID=A0ABU6X424_9FABA|nr:hypothetical protein [Stylosanthes scabra]